MLGFQEPLDCRTACYGGVLDLRTSTVKVESSANSGWSSDGVPSPQDRTSYSPHHDTCTVLTPPRDTSMSPPAMSPRMISPEVPHHMMDVGVVSPTLAITQRVLAAASAPQGTRPFKAYPKDPLALSSHSDAFLQFRQHMLNQVRGSKPGNPRKRPASPISPNTCQQQQQQPSSSGHESDDKDAAYWERRRKNNEAAKRSRDARRAKEDEIAIRAAFLEQENLRLKYQVAALTDETAKLRCMLYKTDQSLFASGNM
uniref:Protein giant n=2 Tax=Lygus hesperus TaxID=30085 RepID=A0A0A9VVX1_LYGHE